MKDGTNPHRGFLSQLEAGAFFKNPAVVERGIASRLGRAGYFFAATDTEVDALDLAAGPKEPLPPPIRRALVSESQIPHLYTVAFLERMASAVLRENGGKRLILVREGTLCGLSVPRGSYISLG